MSLLPTSLSLVSLLVAAAPLAGGLPARPLAPPNPVVQPSADQLALARSFLASQAPSLGLRSSEDLRLLSSLVNPQGELVLRYGQTHQGHPVAGTSLVVRVGTTPTITARQLEAGLQLTGNGPSLQASQAIASAHRDLPAASTYLEAPQAKAIVFPARLAGGLAMRRGPEGSVLDPLRSAPVGTLDAPHLWAWHVTRRVASSQGLQTTLHTVVDGTTGRILRKWSEGADPDPVASGTLLPPPRDYAAMAERRTLPIRVAPPTQARTSASQAPGEVTAYLPAVGTAHTQFSGTVQIPTSQDNTHLVDGNPTYALLDTLRGTGTNPWLTARGLASGNRIFTPEIAVYDWDPETMAPRHIYYDYSMENGAYEDWRTGATLYPGSLDNVWGNGIGAAGVGEVFPGFFSEEAKTSAAEAMHAVTTTYDLLRNVYNRQSLDGQDGPILVQVNYRDAFAGKAAWYDDLGYTQVGMGSSSAFWDDADGRIPVHNGAELTNLAREFGVALHQLAVPRDIDMAQERPHLERSTGALVAQLAQAYAQLQPAQPSGVLPSVAVDWSWGKTRGDGRPWFWLDKPSRDGRSVDAWFDGIWMLGQERLDGIAFGDGPMNRAWYFMSEGASGDPTSPAYSSFLPKGMTGIGLEKVGRIFYKALTERLLSSTGYEGTRSACLAAATDLFGASSPEVTAVANAFAAVNVGAPSGGKEPVRVTFSQNLIAEGTLLAPDPFLQQFMALPTGEWVRLQAKVDHATNPALTWKATGVPEMVMSDGRSTPDQGIFRADGAYMAPSKGDHSWSVQAWSVEDPRQFAQGVVWAFDMDSDGDGTVDALDFADIAMLCYLPTTLKNMIKPLAFLGRFTAIGDAEVQLASLAFNNAFNR